MTINGVQFNAHDYFTVLFRNEMQHFDNNCWFICLDNNQLNEVAKSSTPAFLKLYEYGRKLKDAIEVEESASVLFRPKRYLNAEEFKILADEIAEPYQDQMVPKSLKFLMITMQLNVNDLMHNRNLILRLFSFFFFENLFQ